MLTLARICFQGCEFHITAQIKACHSIDIMSFVIGNSDSDDCAMEAGTESDRAAAIRLYSSEL